MFGLFSLHGPLILDADLNLSERNLTWNKNYSMIYVDNPVGTGNNHSKIYPDNPVATYMNYTGYFHVFGLLFWI